jgi:hypothetical protein
MWTGSITEVFSLEDLESCIFTHASLTDLSSWTAKATALERRLILLKQQVTAQTQLVDALVDAHVHIVSISAMSQLPRVFIMYYVLQGNHAFNEVC